MPVRDSGSGGTGGDDCRGSCRRRGCDGYLALFGIFGLKLAGGNLAVGDDGGRGADGALLGLLLGRRG